MTTNAADLSADKKEKFEKFLSDTVNKSVNDALVEVKGKLDELDKAIPRSIHTKEAGVVDDGKLSQVGHNQYKLPGGSVVNVSNTWNVTGKGFFRNAGMFEALGDESEEFFTKLREDWNTKKHFEAKSVDWSTVMNTQDDQSAGLFVPEDIRYAMLQFAPPGTIVWPRAQVWPMTTQKIQWPKLDQDLTEDNEDFFGNVRMRWTEEGHSKPSTKAQFGMLTLECHEISAFTPVTDILLQDSAINIGNLLVQLFQGAYWHYTDRVFLRGFGATRPMGVLNAPGVTTVSRVTSGTVGYADCLNMQSQLPPMFDAGAVWFMKKQVFNTLRKEKDDQGRPIMELGQGYNNFGEGVAGYMLGLPVVMSDYKTSALGSTGDVVLGDWKHYFIGERKTVSVEMSRHFLFDDNQTAFRASARVGGTPEQEKAFVVLSSTADPNMS
jgi:HK97 family phage major capsid protein